MYERKVKFSNVDGNLDTMVIMTGRARQLIHLLGYELIDNSVPALSLGGDGQLVQELLLTAEPDLAGQITAPPLGVFTGKSSTLDYRANVLTHDQLTSGQAMVKASQSHGWVPCDFLVPSLFLVKGRDNTSWGYARVEWGIVLNFNWVDADLSTIAAVNLRFGRDPVDSDEDINLTVSRGPSA